MMNEFSEVITQGKMTETFNAYKYIVRVKQQSAINPEEVFDIETAIICPRCKAELPLLKHGENQKCKFCDLYMELWGNALRCTVTLEFRVAQTGETQYEKEAEL